MTKKAKRDFFKQATKDGIMTSKKFWRTVQPFWTNNGCISNDFIGVENEGNLIYKEQELVELLNEHYISIVEKSFGKKPFSVWNSSHASQDEITVKEIISVHSNHPSTRKIKNLGNSENEFDLPYVSTSKINKIIKSLNVNKAKGADGISAKFIKMSANVIANIINNDISLNKYSKHAKTATVKPIFKKEDWANIKNYRPVSLLNIFSKIYERFLHENLTNYVEILL